MRSFAKIVSTASASPLGRACACSSSSGTTLLPSGRYAPRPKKNFQLPPQPRSKTWNGLLSTFWGLGLPIRSLHPRPQYPERSSGGSLRVINASSASLQFQQSEVPRSWMKRHWIVHIRHRQELRHNPVTHHLHLTPCTWGLRTTSGQFRRPPPRSWGLRPRQGLSAYPLTDSSPHAS